MTLQHSFSAGVGLFLILGVAAPIACSSSNPNTPAPDADGGTGGSKCQDSQCKSGNKCVDDGTDTKCRLICEKQADCPDKYRCVQNPNGDHLYCAALTGSAADITVKDHGQYGAPCNPAGGLDANPDCDSEQNFWCYGLNPTDAQAFCTQYQCGGDSDCPGGYWCAPINEGPDVRTTKRTIRRTTTACLPRTYCSPCTSDVDCPTDQGATQHCVGTDDGNHFCMRECSNNGNCRLDATCEDDNGTKVCKPRAGTCKGDGSLCSPCYADEDCKDDGVCITQSYSHEKYCAVKSPTACRIVNGKLEATCPKVDIKGVQVGCQTTRTDPNIPKDMCIGIIPFGSNDGVADGCWTQERK